VECQSFSSSGTGEFSLPLFSCPKHRIGIKLERSESNTAAGPDLVAPRPKSIILIISPCFLRNVAFSNNQQRVRVKTGDLFSSKNRRTDVAQQHCSKWHGPDSFLRYTSPPTINSIHARLDDCAPGSIGLMPALKNNRSASNNASRVSRDRP
jgi:hypothetical protein